jgi:hypothetical protein
VIAGDGGSRALARPEESLVDLLLRKVPRLDLGNYDIDKFDFGLQPRLQANDQAVVERNRLAWLSRSNVDLFDFVSGGALHNSTANDRSENKRRTRNQSSKTHGELPKANVEKIGAQRGGETRWVRVASSPARDKIGRPKFVG